MSRFLLHRHITRQPLQVLLHAARCTVELSQVLVGQTIQPKHPGLVADLLAHRLPPLPEQLRTSASTRSVAVSVHKVHIEPMGGIDPTLILWRIMTYAAKKTSRFLSSDPRGRYEVAQWVAWQLVGQGPGTPPE
jgi:hypothetical protein